MLSGIFNYDNPVWRFIGKFGDLIILNILWIVCSIPLFTIGASTTAVYYVTMKLSRDDDGYTIRSFFKSFKENFKQATAIWLIVVAVGVILGIDIFFFTKIFNGSAAVQTIMTTIFLAMLIIYVFIAFYVFPLQARFYNTVKRTFFNAFFMSVRHLLHTIGMIVIDVVLFALAFLFYIPPVAMAVVLFGFPLFAFINSYMIRSIMAKYTPAEENDGTLRPLFENEEDLIPQPGSLIGSGAARSSQPSEEGKEEVLDSQPGPTEEAAKETKAQQSKEE